MGSIIIYSVGTGLSGIATNLYMLAVCRFIVGLGMSGEYACASTYAVESWPKNLQSKASAFLVSGFSVGNIIAAQIIPQFAEVYGWRNSFFIGLLPVLLVLWIDRRTFEADEPFAHLVQKGIPAPFHDAAPQMVHPPTPDAFASAADFDFEVDFGNRQCLYIPQHVALY